MAYHISDDNLERLTVDTVKDEAELGTLEEHLLACGECARRLEETREYIRTMKAAPTRQERAGKRPLTIAFHEAGHAAVAFICRVPFSEIWIAPTEDTKGWTGTPDPPADCTAEAHRRLIERHILVLLAGRVAEIWCGAAGAPFSFIDRSEAMELCCKLHGEQYASALSVLRARVEEWFRAPGVWEAVETLADALMAPLAAAQKASLPGETATSILAEHIPERLRLPAIEQ
jgi:hypothetical protein